MLKFSEIGNLYWLLAIPVLVLLFWLAMRWKERMRSKFATSDLFMKLAPDVSNASVIVKFVLRILAIAFVIVALSRPQSGEKTEEVKREGIDLMVCLDVSNSMKAEDIKPNRLQKAKRSISKLIERLSGDRIGLIVFAGEAYTQLPITTDLSAAKLFLSSVSTSTVPTQGTAIGAAIERAIDSFQKESGSNKAIIILTDGENHEEGAIKAAEKASEKGIIVHTIGMGTPEGGPIPIYRNKKQVGFRKDKEGHTVVTSLNESMLAEIASVGGGRYIRANNTTTGLNMLFSELEKIQKEEYGSSVFTSYEDRFQWALLPAIILLFLSFLFNERKSQFVRDLKMFEE